MAFNINSIISSPPEAIKILSEFQKDVFNVKDTKLTYRALNHYKKVGVIGTINNKEKTWSKFNGIELIWIDIILQLRELGVSLEKIIQVKYFLFDKGVLGSIDKANSINNSFEQEIALAILNKYDLYLVVFSDLSCTFYDNLSIKQWYLKPYKDESHINIPLSKIIKEVEHKIKRS